MKKRLLLISASTLMLATLIMSNAGGPAHISLANRTGSDGSSTTNCSTVGCHSGGSYTNIFPDIRLSDIMTNTATHFIPGDTFTVNIETSQCNAPKWGFQVSVSTFDGTYHPVGNLIAINPSTHDTTVNGFQIVEQKSTLTIFSNLMTSMNMRWIAPADTTIDSVTFYCTINMVNGDGTTGGDNSMNFKRTYYRQGFVASVKELSAAIDIKAFPNPLSNELNISLSNAEKGNYNFRIFDLNGRTVAEQESNISGSKTLQFNTTAWPAGVYHLQVSKDGASKTLSLIKQ